jgi:spermidine/putrescine transport system permease protein
MKMIKKTLAAVLAAAMLSGIALTGCGSTVSTGAAPSSAPETSASADSASSAAPAAAGGELNLFVWTEYMPQTVFDEFTKETGIKVNVSTYSSNEDMLSKVKGSNEGIYDIVVPSDYMVKMMIDQGLLEKLDKSKLTNLSNIDPAFLDQYFDKGNEYSVPYLGGVAAICVNKAKVTDNITSFKQLLDPKYKNSVVALDDFRAVIGATAKSQGFSLSTTKEDELAKVKTALTSLKPNIKVLDSDSPKTSMINGETNLGYMWSAEIALAMQESKDFDIVFPDEGCYVFLDNLCITKGAKNAANANAFLNFIMKPETGKLVLDEFPYLSPNKAAVALMPDSYKNNKASNVPSDVIQKGEYVKDIGSDVEKYDALWTEFTK